MKLEQAWYECSPFLYLAAGSAAALDARGSLLLAGSGLILIVLAATVIGLRWVYRQGGARTPHDDLLKIYNASVSMSIRAVSNRSGVAAKATCRQRWRWSQEGA